MAQLNAANLLGDRAPANKKMLRVDHRRLTAALLLARNGTIVKAADEFYDCQQAFLGILHDPAVSVQLWGTFSVKDNDAPHFNVNIQTRRGLYSVHVYCQLSGGVITITHATNKDLQTRKIRPIVTLVPGYDPERVEMDNQLVGAVKAGLAPNDTLAKLVVELKYKAALDFIQMSTGRNGSAKAKLLHTGTCTVDEGFSAVATSSGATRTRFRITVPRCPGAEPLVAHVYGELVNCNFYVQSVVEARRGAGGAYHDVAGGTILTFPADSRWDYV